jgi:hypothetical protein
MEFKEWWSQIKHAREVADAVIDIFEGIGQEAWDASAKEKDKEIWHLKYKIRLMDRGGLTESEAEDALQAGMDEYDYEEDPVDFADHEMSYWTD